MSKKDPSSIDDKFKSLETNIKQLENDTLPIEKALELYESSMELVKNCQAELSDIEQKVSIYQNGQLNALEKE
jgi:exodeoxyribonuclease VII small subunit